MLPFKNILQLDRDERRPLYLQLCDQLVSLIKLGHLSPGSRLPGSRALAIELEVHRKTIVATYDELIAQGWIESIPSRGTFVSKQLPIVQPKSYAANSPTKREDSPCGFEFILHPGLERKREWQSKDNLLRIGDGDPDIRLAPATEVARHYRNIATKKHHQDLLGYGSTYGNEQLRKALVAYLNRTRGLNISKEQVLIIRGSQMGVYLASQLLLSQKDVVLVGESNYRTSEITFQQAGAQLFRVPVDEAGIDTTAIEAYLQENTAKAIFLTSHHHHPTTVTLSAERRMHLLQLAQKYGLAIVEDDYDYDFHYANAPILPLASNDTGGNVLYIGGFTKIIAPAFRVGYLIGPPAFIEEAARLRRIIDRQGDQLLEQVMARMLQSGDVERHCNKVRKIYKSRRDLFCQLLKEKLDTFFEFQIPAGGMAVWVKLKKPYHWKAIYEAAPKFGLYFNNHWERYDAAGMGHQGIRMGFAVLSESEIQALIDRLEKLMKSLL